MDTPNTRSRAKRELEAALGSTPGASQDEPRVLWEHDRRWKREFVDNMRDDALPIPAPTQQPSLPRIIPNPSAAARPRKRPCNRNRSVPTGSTSNGTPIASTAGSSSAPIATGGRSNIDKLLEDYFALHGGGASTSSARQGAAEKPAIDVEMPSSPSRRTSRNAPVSPDHPLPQMSSLALESAETPSKRTAAPRPSHVARGSLRPNRQTPQRQPPSTSITTASARTAQPAASSPLQSVPLQPSQSRRLGPTLSQGESAKSLGPAPRIGLRTAHDPNKPPPSHNPAKAFKSPMPSAPQGVRSSPRRQPPPPHISPTTTTSTNAKVAGPVRIVQGQASKPAPSPLRNTRTSFAGPQRAPPMGLGATARPAPLPRLDDKMASSDGAATGDESFGSLDFDFAGGGEEFDAILAQIDGRSQ